MKKEKFLTVYAVLDQITQEKLSFLQSEILQVYPKGTQTMGIPFHISLGSFPIEQKDELICRIANSIEHLSPFDITLEGIGEFDYKVIYIQPIMNSKLVELHKAFHGNYADGFDWIPHVTLFCGTEEDGKKIVSQWNVERMNAQIVGIQLGEFFPSKILMDCKF